MCECIGGSGVASRPASCSCNPGEPPMQAGVGAGVTARHGVEAALVEAVGLLHFGGSGSGLRQPAARACASSTRCSAERSACSGRPGGLAS